MRKQIQADAKRLREVAGKLTVMMTAYLMLRHKTNYKAVLEALHMEYKYDRIVGVRNVADGAVITVGYLRDRALQEKDLYDAMLEGESEA